MMFIVIQIDGKNNKVNDYAIYSSVGHHNSINFLIRNVLARTY